MGCDVARDPDHPDGNQHLTGFHSVQSVLRRHVRNVRELWVDQSRRDSRMTSLVQLAEDAGVTVHRVPRRQLDTRSGGIRHQGVLAVCRWPLVNKSQGWESFLATLHSAPFLLVLDQVQDPHNLGACIRTAECAGVDGVILPRDGAAPVNDTVRRVAAGAAERMPVHYVTNLARSLDSLKSRGIWIIGTSDRAECSLHRADLSGPVALVLGAEDKGMRRLTWEACDRVVRIPMMGTVSSLNVSVAAGVVLFEAKRQRDIGYGRQI